MCALSCCDGWEKWPVCGGMLARGAAAPSMLSYGLVDSCCLLLIFLSIQAVSLRGYLGLLWDCTALLYALLPGVDSPGLVVSAAA